MNQPTDILTGRKEIARYLRYHDWRGVERTLIPMGAPIAKIGGIWRASKRQLLEWVENEIERQQCGLSN